MIQSTRTIQTEPKRKSTGKGDFGFGPLFVFGEEIDKDKESGESGGMCWVGNCVYV